MLNEAGVDYELVNVLDETYNPGLRDAIKNYSQWPTIPQACQPSRFAWLYPVHDVRDDVSALHP